MQEILKPLSFLSTILLVVLSLTGCSGSNISHWSEVIPDSAPYLIVPEENSSINDILEAPYLPIFDDLTPSAIQLTAEIDQAASNRVVVKAIVLFTDTSTDWRPAWIIDSVPGLMDFMRENHQEPFTQNRYEFGSYEIEKFTISDRALFAVNLGNYTLFSESSLAVENMLRTKSGQQPVMELTEQQLQPGSFIANTHSLDQWVKQMADVSYMPSLNNLFDGGKPVSFTLNDNEDQEWAWQLNGELELEEQPSVLLRSLSSASEEFILDRYISNNAAAFSIQRLEASRIAPEDEEPESETDRYLSEHPELWQRIADQLNDEIAFVSFAESGAESSSEYLFLRHLNNGDELYAALSELANEDLVEQTGDTFLIQSHWLGQLIGSKLNPMIDFYLHIFDDIAILSQRRGLAESVPGDTERRRVMFYDDDYMMVRDDVDMPISSILYADMQQFGTYIQPWLAPQNNFSALTSNLDLVVITTKYQPDQSATEISLNSYQRDVEEDPYRERWIYPLSGQLTGKPVLADITESSRNEVIFSTEEGTIYAVATDGTEVMQANTGSDEPVGPPVVYDWYGNNQDVIMQAAGNNIYAWNRDGQILPNFPISLNENITTPLTVMDINRNGVAEIIVGTADRNLHILNSRGQPISGWPQSVNSVISEKPLIGQLNNQRTVIATAENTIHSWSINGQIRGNFPVFLDSQLHGSPSLYNNHLLGAGRDGNLYSIGTTPLFSEDYATEIRDDSLFIQALQVASGSLNATPFTENIFISNEEQSFREDLIVVQSSNGSVFLYNSDGVLRFTRSMGQPASGSHPPQIIDINSDQQPEIVTLADFGRLYAWNLLSEERIFELPTTGMDYPLITDLYGDNNNEIIAQTREGLRCWTIYRAAAELE